MIYMKNEIWLKIGFIFLLVGFVLILISWNFSYPIHISKINENTLDQFYPTLWPGIIICLLSLFTILYNSNNKIIGAICCSLFPLVLHVPAFFFSYLSSSDSGNVRGMFQVYNIIGPNSHVIPYFEFQNYFNLNEIIYKVVDIDEKIIASLSYVLYGILLALFLFILFYKLKKEQYVQLIPFVSVFAYFIGMYSFLDYQWVPQTLALVYFFTLLYITSYVLSDSTNNKWRFIFITIFVSFIFTHPFLPVIFLIFFFILAIRKRNLLPLFIVITSLYVIVTIYHNIYNFNTYVFTLEQSLHGFGGEYISRVTQSFQGNTNILDSIISFANRITIPAIWFIACLGILLLFLKKKIDYFLISLGLGGLVYLIVGFFYAVLGLRSAQIFFIPMTLGFMFYFPKWKKLVMIFFVVILILSVFGSIRMAYNNTAFQTDAEACGCNFLAEKIINVSHPKVAIDQVDWGYFTDKYSYLKNTTSLAFAIRPGSVDFLESFSNLTQSKYIFFNTNLGKEILDKGLMSKDQLWIKQKEYENNNVIYSSGTTYIINGVRLKEFSYFSNSTIKYR